MPSTAGSVITRAAAHLNDVNQLTYTTGVLLPFYNSALDELDGELAVHEVTPLITDSITIDVDIDDTELAQMPVDFVDAISLLERPRDSDQDWIEVKEKKEIDLNIRTSDSILQWCLRNATIEINPPQTDREILLRYIRGLTTASSGSTAVDIEVTRHYLALLTARNAALDLGNSAAKGSMFDNRIALAKDRCIRRLQKSNQSVAGVRRRPYTGRVR